MTTRIAVGHDAPVKVMVKRHRRAEQLANPSHGFIEAEHEGESTLDVCQEDISLAVDLSGKAKKWRRVLQKRGPYKIDYSEDGSHLLAYGSEGEAHLLSAGDGSGSGDGGARAKKDALLSTYERVLCGKICYNENCFALGQKNSLCLYDKKGIRIHDFDNSDMITSLDYLPYHFLLVSASAYNISRGIQWRDLSTGKFVGQLVARSLSKSTESLRKNNYNGCVYTGHKDGLVKIWSPNLDSEALAFHGHCGEVESVHPFNHTYVAVAGAKSLLKIYDIRNPSESINHHRLKSTGAISIDSSQSGLLAVSQGPQVNIWNKPWKQSDKKFYLTHRYQNSGLRFENIRFQPFEDILGCGLNTGFETLFVPGAGTPSIDNLENNPYATDREKAKALVRRLLDKLPHQTIVLDPTQLLSYHRKRAEGELRVSQSGGKGEPKASSG